MLSQNSILRRSKTGAFRRIFISTIIGCAALFYWLPSALSSTLSTPAVKLSALRFYYPSDGSLAIELVSEGAIEDYQIRTLPGKTIVYIRGAGSTLHPFYLVRNFFNVAVKTGARELGGEPGVELVIATPPGARVTPVREPGKLFFLIRSSAPVASRPARQTAPTGKNGTAGKSQRAQANAPLVKTGKAAYQPQINVSLDLPSPLKEGKGAIGGQVKDELGGVIAGAEVTIIDSQGREWSTQTNADGIYRFTNLAAGKYVVKIKAPNFAQFESRQIDITGQPAEKLDVALKVSIETEVVTVGADVQLSADLDGSANSLTLRENELNSLPEDPQGLAATLQGLAMATGNGSSSQVVVDGFPGGRIPPKRAIREIRISKNPYSAEFNRPGNGRIEILTKPGMENFNGGAFLGFNNDQLNTRDPFATQTLPYQSNNYGFYLGGPVKPKKASFFFNFEKGRTDSNNLINASVLDPNLNVVAFNSSSYSPNRFLNFTPRIDLQLDERNTLVSRYSFSRSSTENAGVGGFSLLSRAYNVSQTEHSLQFTETAIINPRLVNEVRSQFVRRASRREPGRFGLNVDVPGAFIDGGAAFKNIANEYGRIEANNIATLSLAKHSLRFGGGFRYIGISDFSSQNFGGTYRFDGAVAPQLDDAGNIIVDSNGRSQLAPISGLERYRRTLSLTQLGLSPQEIRERGGGAAQFTVSTGEEQASVNQSGIYAFVQDDWRIRPNFSLGLGLRFESQSNVENNLTFAPRVSFAWSKNRAAGSGAKKDEKIDFVLRGGIGFFYETLGENLTLRANRLNGARQRQYLVTAPEILDLFPMLPGAGLLAGFSAAPSVVVRIDPDLQLPLSIQSNISFEKQLPAKFVLSTNYLNVRTFNALRSRFVRGAGSGAGSRIFQYESTGNFTQNQLSLTLSKRLSKYSFYAIYTLGSARSDTDGADSIPLFDDDSGRAQSDVRHSVYFGGWFRAWWNIDINPLIYYRSGIPYDITLGRDLNGDTILNDRPAFATDLNRSSVIVTPLGAFDLDPLPGQSIIPRNYGTSESFLAANLNIGKTFTFFGENGSQAKNEKFSLLGVEVARRALYLTISLQIENLFNQTNPYLPEGNLSSPLFGRSSFSAGAYGFGVAAPGNRVIRPYIVFNF